MDVVLPSAAYVAVVLQKVNLLSAEGMGCRYCLVGAARVRYVRLDSRGRAQRWNSFAADRSVEVRMLVCPACWST